MGIVNKCNFIRKQRIFSPFVLFAFVESQNSVKLESRRITKRAIIEVKATEKIALVRQ